MSSFGARKLVMWVHVHYRVDRRAATLDFDRSRCDAYEMNIAPGCGAGETQPLKTPDFLYFTIVQRSDYRPNWSKLKPKQADLEREREGILSALGLLDEADSESIRGKISPQDSQAGNIRDDSSEYRSKGTRTPNKIQPGGDSRDREYVSSGSPFRPSAQGRLKDLNTCKVNPPHRSKYVQSEPPYK